MGALVASCVWRATEALVVTLDGRFGEPVDSYVNGSQVWLREDGPGGALVEWRLHPVPGYHRPGGVATEEVFSAAALAWGAGAPERPPAPLAELWDGLEAFPVSPDDAVEPQPLAAAVAAALGVAPDAVGMVDHDVIGDEWERTGRRISVTAALLDQLRSPA